MPSAKEKLTEKCWHRLKQASEALTIGLFSEEPEKSQLRPNAVARIKNRARICVIPNRFAIAGVC
jgi:hypothetical protein